MKKTVKIWLTVAASFLLVGIIIFGGMMTMLKWDFSKLSTAKLETNEHEITEEFSNITVKTNTANIIFTISDDEKYRVICYEEKKATHSVTVQEDTLVINIVNKKAWYDYIGFNFSSPKITIYLPKTEYNSLVIKESTGDIEIAKEMKFKNMDISVSTGDVKCYASAEEAIKIATTTGDICVEGISAGSLDLSVSTGKITVSDTICENEFNIAVSTGNTVLSGIKCKNLTSTGSTGNITLTDIIATEKFSIERSTGSVKFDGCDAAELFVETDTGNVTGTLLSEKVFIIDTNTGKKDVPKTISGGRCEITTDTGDIKIAIKSS